MEYESYISKLSLQKIYRRYNECIDHLCYHDHGYGISWPQKTIYFQLIIPTQSYPLLIDCSSTVVCGARPVSLARKLRIQPWVLVRFVLIGPQGSLYYFVYCCLSCLCFSILTITLSVSLTFRVMSFDIPSVYSASFLYRQRVKRVPCLCYHLHLQF